VALLGAVALLLLGAGTARAARTLEREITEAGGANGPTLVHPEGVALDASNHLWVTENFVEHASVEKYGPTGSFENDVLAPPWPANPSLESIAFDKAAGALFVSESGSDEVDGLAQANAQYTGTQLLPLGAPRVNGSNCCDLRLAADNSGDAYNGDLYVFAGNGGGNAHVIRINSSTGAPVDYTEGSSAGSDELTGADTPAHSFVGPGSFGQGGIAVDAAGHLWVADGTHDALDEFAPTGRYLHSITQIAPSEPLGQLLAVAIDPTTGNVLVNNVSINGVDEFTPSGTFVGATRSSAAGQILGIAVNSAGKLYIANSSGASAVEVFGPAGAPDAKLALTVNITGEGEVSGPGGIACTGAGAGTSACESAFVEGTEVELVAHPAAGYTLAGWLDCKPVAAGRCEATLDAAREVTAVFLKEAEAPVITPFSGNENGCVDGGVEVTVGGHTTYVCNGTNGANGTDGANGTNGTNGKEGKEGPKGSEGPQGIEGLQGVEGAKGKEGPQGKEGSQGKEGAPGKSGAQGPPGPVAKVTCKVKQQGAKKVKVTCTVAQSASSARARLRWRLVHDGRAVGQGISNGALRLDLRHLRPGRYLLYVQGQRHATAIVVG
jgi:hypothetical protein